MEELKNIKVALLGSGTVGTGVYKLIERQREELPHKVGAGLTVSKVLVRDKNKKREGIDPSVLTDQWEDIITDDEIQIVVEVMGGIEPARTYITEALQAGKNVVTANKDLMAVHGGELLDIASHNGCDLLFEASVAGGIPIIRPLKQCLAGNYISEAMGIVNGTTNFILTKMTHEGMEFDEALALATELGYAEADPTADIEGYDAGRKMAIMASIAFNSRVTFDDVYTEGITNITAKDIKYAEAMGCTIKLLGVAKNTESGIEVRVHPMLIHWQLSMIHLTQFLYMEMQLTMQCSMEEEQENSQQQVQLWEISLMSHVIFSSIAQEESIVHATKTFQSRRSQRLKANIS